MKQIVHVCSRFPGAAIKPPLQERQQVARESVGAGIEFPLIRDGKANLLEAAGYPEREITLRQIEIRLDPAGGDQGATKFPGARDVRKEFRHGSHATRFLLPGRENVAPHLQAVLKLA